MRNLFRQRNVPWLGAVVESLFTSLPVLSIINFLAISTVLYATIREYLIALLPWMSFGVFVGFLVLLTLGLMAAIYILVLPSLWTFRGKQLYGFESDLLKEVRALREEVRELKEKVE